MSILNAFHDMPKSRKIQVVTAMMLTLGIMIVTPTYSWFRKQQKMARYQKVGSPNTLYITAASREDARNFQIAGVDVSNSAYWLNNDKSMAGRKTYQDYVFAVAGDYVVSYTLQLAHTTNNKYTYEIFEAEVMEEPPVGAVLDRDYVVYNITGDFEPAILEEITANPVYTTKAATDKKLYYKIRKIEKANQDDIPISLSSSNPYSTSAEVSSYDLNNDEKVDLTYNGHYLNWKTDFTANTTYHTNTYDSDENNVEDHAEPLYWQATGITGGDPTSGDPFYHEYILRISWDISGDKAASADYKDTDIIYITAKAD